MPERFPIDEFRDRRFDYDDGQHAAFFGPTQMSGKSTTAFYLLERAATAERPGVALTMKHADRVVAGWTRRLNWQETSGWPPRRKLSNWRPAGYTLWPPQTLTDPEADNARIAREFRRAITHQRTHRPSITFADELYGLVAELPDMRTLLTSVVTRDSVAGHGLWYATQKPSGTQGISIPGFFFNSAEHMFFAKDGEERNRKRYGEISCGIDPREIERVTLGLDPYSWLYIRRTGPQWAIVDAYDSSLAM